MTRKILLLLLVTVCLSCKKNHQKPGCSISVCTQEFASIGIRFVNKAGSGVTVTNFSAKNLRSDSLIVAGGGVDPGFSPGFKAIATDNNLEQFSTGGDDVRVSATNPSTDQTKTAIVKIAGGCACHISKISGPDTVVFD